MTTKNDTDNVIPLRASKQETDRQADKKWSPAVMKTGYSIVPVLLLHAQKRLGLTPAHLNVVLQIASHWWSAGDLPYPSKATIANRMNCSERQVQRYLTDLEKAGLIGRIERFHVKGGQMSNRYNLAGLVKKLKEIAPEFQAEAERKKKHRAELEKPGGGKLRAKPSQVSPGNASS